MAKVSTTIKGDSYANYLPYKVNVTCTIANLNTASNGRIIIDEQEKERKRKDEDDKKKKLANNIEEARDIIVPCMNELVKELKDTWLGKPRVLPVSGTLEGDRVMVVAQSYKLKKLLNNSRVVQNLKNNTKTCMTDKNVNSISIALKFNKELQNGRPIQL